jgi:hypothetical protein
LPLFYELLSSEDLREEVCECLYEVPYQSRLRHNGKQEIPEY